VTTGFFTAKAPSSAKGRQDYYGFDHEEDKEH
jgi:hypothetical protein